MATDNMRVINEEYDRVMANPDNMIMSDGLAGRLMGNQTEVASAHGDSHELYLTNVSNVMEIASTVGTLHTLRQVTAREVMVSFEVANISQDMLKTLYNAVANDSDMNIKLVGSGGFSCESATISQWDLMKVAPHQHLLSLTFGGDNVTF